jgi:hypothetical protein
MNLNAIGSRGALAPMVQDELGRTTAMLTARWIPSAVEPPWISAISVITTSAPAARCAASSVHLATPTTRPKPPL